LAVFQEAVRQSNNDIKAKAFGSVLRFFETPSSRMSFNVDDDDDDDDDDDGGGDDDGDGVLPWKYSGFRHRFP